MKNVRNPNIFAKFIHSNSEFEDAAESWVGDAVCALLVEHAWIRVVFGCGIERSVAEAKSEVDLRDKQPWA